MPSPSVRLPWFNHINVCFYLRLAELITKLTNAHTNVFADGLKRNKKNRNKPELEKRENGSK